jgi:hypothetical protein
MKFVPGKRPDDDDVVGGDADDLDIDDESPLDIDEEVEIGLEEEAVLDDEDEEDLDDEDDEDDEEEDDDEDEEDVDDDADFDADSEVTCPYCGETITVLLDPGSGSTQEYVEDCEVCCRPWRVRVKYNRAGRATVHVDPAQ